MDLDHLDPRKKSRWLCGTGPQQDIVVSSRVRLARNLAGFPFLTRATARQQREIDRRLRGALAGPLTEQGEVFTVEMQQLSALDRVFLVERHLISRELADGNGIRSVVFDPGEARSVMINEEDHVRLQALESGFGLRAAFESVHRLDDALEAEHAYAFHPAYGYLTACPTNVGTGMRTSVMLHLPALQISKHIEKVFHAAQKMHLVVRGFYGEGTQAYGDFFQVSNQSTLGDAEEHYLKVMETVVPKIAEYERKMRDLLLRNERAKFEDRIHRARAILDATRTIASEEALAHLSTVRMGVHLGVIGDLSVERVNELYVLTQPAHLQKIVGRELEDEERDVERASYLRRMLGSDS